MTSALKAAMVRDSCGPARGMHRKCVGLGRDGEGILVFVGTDSRYSFPGSLCYNWCEVDPGWGIIKKA